MDEHTDKQVFWDLSPRITVVIPVFRLEKPLIVSPVWRLIHHLESSRGVGDAKVEMHPLLRELLDLVGVEAALMTVNEEDMRTLRCNLLNVGHKHTRSSKSRIFSNVGHERDHARCQSTKISRSSDPVAACEAQNGCSPEQRYRASGGLQTR